VAAPFLGELNFESMRMPRWVATEFTRQRRRGSSPTVREGSIIANEPSFTVGLLSRPPADIKRKPAVVSWEWRPYKLTPLNAFENQAW
jgi:hypothetical protein